MIPIGDGLPSTLSSVKSTPTLPHSSVHPQSVEAGVLWVAVVLVDGQLHRFISGLLRLLAQPERLDWLPGGRVGEVEQRRKRVSLSDPRQGEGVGGRVDVAVGGEKWGDVFNGDRRDEDWGGELDNNRTVASPECPTLARR